MTFQRLAQLFEIKFWDIVIPIMDKQGVLMKWMDFFYRIVHTKISYLMLLVLVWSIVGFVIGLAMGRIFWMLQLL